MPGESSVAGELGAREDEQHQKQATLPDAESNHGSDLLHDSTLDMASTERLQYGPWSLWASGCASCEGALCSKGAWAHSLVVLWMIYRFKTFRFVKLGTVQNGGTVVGNSVCWCWDLLPEWPERPQFLRLSLFAVDWNFCSTTVRC